MVYKIAKFMVMVQMQFIMYYVYDVLWYLRFVLFVDDED